MGRNLDDWEYDKMENGVTVRFQLLPVLKFQIERYTTLMRLSEEELTSWAKTCNSAEYQVIQGRIRDLKRRRELKGYGKPDKIPKIENELMGWRML